MALSGVVPLFAAISYRILQQLIIASQGQESVIKKAIGDDWKGRLSLIVYAAAISKAFVSLWIFLALNLFVALGWLIPDKRIREALSRK